MTNISMSQNDFKNEENPFTELFSLIKCYEISPDESPTLIYSSSELKIMYQHIDNAIDTLLLGLQDLGHLMVAIKNGANVKFKKIGFLISSVSNLIQALNILQDDIAHALKKQCFEVEN